MYSRNYRHRWWNNIEVQMFFGMLVLIGLVVGIPAVIKASNIQELQITVCDKERVAVHGGGEYRIYAVEGSFVVEDSILAGVRFESADFYARIKTPATYDIRTKGFRVGFLSWFPNILEAHEVSDEGAKMACEEAGLRIGSN